MKWPGVGQSSRSVHSVCGKQERAMSTLGRSKDKTWGVALRPGMDMATLRSAWEERRLLNGFNRKLTRWFESPRLSTASISSNERAPSATPSDCSDFPSAGQRPVSLVSTLSSGSGSSRDDGPAPPPPGGTVPPTGDDIDLELNPPVGVGDQDRQHPDTADPSGEGLVSRGGKFNQLNNTDTPSRAASTRHTPPLSPFAAITMAPNPKITYLDRVVMEIIETERMYVRDLRSIVEDYLAHIIDQADLPIRPEQVCALFGNIEDIYEFNSELLQSLDMCDNDPVAIARCFVMKREYFEIYTQYCTNYPNSVAALTDCMRNKSLAKLFRERQASLKRSLPLGSYLLKPVQRILKYHLLLQEIAKHFDPQEEGYEVVEEAIYTMTGVAWYINDMKRKHEHAVRLQEVQSLLINWKGPDLTTYGELVLEGTFKVHRAKNERTLFLFDRMLLITRRRGEHYVFKTLISCSTLMLIESAKDSLSFSVTHYKHPKQPHTVQAKTVEERKLWAHHIKRIILENHQAIIPQKAKEAILEMDSIYPSKFRYSPERMKKAMSCQSDEFPREGRQGRRQSEPTKQILKNTKAVLKHADSEGALPDDPRSIQAAASISTLGSSLGESEAERPSVEEEEEEEEEEEDMGLRKGSLERLSPSDIEEPRTGSSSHKGRATLGEECDSDDILMEEDQVEDFASSMLAAISCWHYRARALLSMGVTTDEEGDDVVEENGSYKENGISSGPVLQSETEQSTSIAEKAPQEKPLLQTKTSASESTERLKPAPSDPEKASATPPKVCTTPPKVCTTPPKVCTTPPKVCTTPPKVCTTPPKVCTTPPKVCTTPRWIALPEPQSDKEDAMEEQTGASSVSQSDDIKTLSSAESSEEEEEEEVSAAQESGPSSILPPSVLNQASAIAEHFTNSARRGSTDDARSLGCPSPRLPSRTGSTLSLGGEGNERPHWLNSSCFEPTQDNFGGTDLTMLSPRDDSLFEIHRRRDSTLSKQDQLLIDKIKSYYETAEHQDANFSLRRRESLTYIPTGLVKNSVSWFNSSDESPGAEKSDTSALATSSAPHPSTSEPADSSKAPGVWDCMTSGASFDSLELERSKKPEVVGSEAERKDRSLGFQERHIQDDEFRPSSEMIKVWQDMEKKGSRSQGEARGPVKDTEAQHKTSRVAGPSLSRRSQTPKKNSESEPDDSFMILEEADLSTITEESMSPSPIKSKVLGLGRTASVRDPRRSRVDEGRLSRAPMPRVIQLRAEEGEEASKEPQSPDDAEMAKNKVFQLARQYSQRIKCTTPAPRQRDVLFGKKNLPCVIEEKPESSGKPNLTLPLLSFDRVSNLQELSPIAISPNPAHMPSSLGSPRVLSPGRMSAKSPLNPTPTEAFNWPDVRTLRCKYASSDKDQSQLPPVNRSRSVPERMDSGPKRRSSFCSSLVTASGTVEAPAYRPHLSRDPGPGEGLARLHRAGSLDQRLSGLHLSELQNLQDEVSNDSYYISAQATMPNDHRVVVVEKVPEPETESSSAEPLEMVLRARRVEVVEDIDDSYVQIRSPTTREKISIMAVIDRCRAYQESDEYRQREEGGAKAESVPLSGRGKELDKGPPSNEKLEDAQKTAMNLVKKTDASQQNVVKNLRQKFLNLR
ncbi:pleckstrin homology domain-containing family G member 3 isoform X3 [Oncorhynchus kisutch]|uniref:pleckstrin homology domain-containing family G member 3 isoform X3 n=1 Tax=Oncorhynchus kisutch TaxID=8019 RepID=UPI0012DEB696|nr:pleckstrin homology domain-containing family G member 3-like isoform X3 [Oncorhynchus kisutch]